MADLDNASVGKQGASTVRIVIFDDSETAIDEYKKELLADPLTEVKFFVRPDITQEELEQIVAFSPSLFILDLVMGSSRNDGYSVLRQLKEEPGLAGIPMVVCSRLINETDLGMAEKDRLKKLGVTDALPKFPRFPTRRQLLAYCLISP